MKLAVALIWLLALPLTGCVYGEAVPVNGGRNVIVVRNNYCLFGALRKVYSCGTAKGGRLVDCRETTSP
jgi:hypothetical protein